MILAALALGRGADRPPILEMLTVSIDIGDVSFTEGIPKPERKTGNEVQQWEQHIPAVDQAKIFEEFQQADSSITRKKGGASSPPKR